MPAPLESKMPPPAKPPKPRTLEQKIGVFKPALGEDLSATQLKRAYWFVTHKELLRKMLVGALVFVIVITLGYGLYGIGNYLFFGLPRELQYERDLLTTNPNIAAFREAHRPLDIVVDVPEVFDSDTDSYDIVTRIENPNTEWYATFDFHYAYEGGETESQQITLWPGARTVLYELGFKSDSRPTDPQVAIENLQWNFLSRHVAPDPVVYVAEHTNFEVADAAYEPGGETQLVASNQIKFTITNRTPYSYWTVDAPVLLLSGNRIVGVVYIKVSRFLSGETRNIDIRTPKRLGQVTSIEVLPDAHIFDPENYILPGE